MHRIDRLRERLGTNAVASQITFKGFLRGNLSHLTIIRLNVSAQDPISGG